ncbi:diphthine--ammonia ligase [Nanoarchaeota archaeon]|nr:MAG: diphthine--ammonia ligase [Nanoarchaeota archaeon]
MRLASLFSGGKDSTFSTFLMAQNGFEIAVLVSAKVTGEDSWMFHIPREGRRELAGKMGVPLFEFETKGKKEEELEDLRRALKMVKEKYEIEGVVSGAIESGYQKEKVERICYELGLKHFAPLWRKDPERIMREMLDAGFKVKVVSVSALGLDESWVGREIDEKVIEELVRLREKYGIHISGEGGEYETLVIDGPFPL